MLINLEDKNYTKEELLDILNNNSKYSKELKEEIYKLEESKNKEEKEEKFIFYQDDDKAISEEELYETDDYNLEFENIIESLLPSFRMLDDNNLYEFVEMLHNNYGFLANNIIKRLMAEIIKDKKDLNDMCNSNLSSEDKEEIKEEIKKYNIKFKILEDLLSKEENKEIPKEEQNTIILVPTISGNDRCIDEVKKLDKSYYESIIKLLDSIIYGTFKGHKSFKSINKYLQGVEEVRDVRGRTRIVYDRLDNKKYAVITIFDKHNDTDSKYINMLKEKVENYKSMKKELLENSYDDNFIKEEERKIELLFKILGKEENIHEKK